MKKCFLFIMFFGLLYGCKKTDTVSPVSAQTASDTASKSSGPAQADAQVTSSKFDGPFGLKMGVSLEDLRKITSLTPQKEAGVYKLENLPAPHPKFDEYFAVVGEKDGLCKIIATTPIHSTSVYGSELRSGYDELKNALNGKYGQSAKMVEHDFLRAGSIWNDGRDFMMALFKQERVLAAYWNDGTTETPKNANRLPNSIQSLSLEPVATGTEKYYLKVTYDFMNIDSCLTSIKNQVNKSL